MKAIMERTESVLGRVGRVHRKSRPILSELEGKPCRLCGWLRYYLVIRSRSTGPSGTLEARCSRCDGRRKFMPGGFEHDVDRTSLRNSNGPRGHGADAS
ncbi:MAG: hypothetical protein KatS3mg082_0102 [Nitrospiraceae bacterium]|nr:MAG: hypothetical protein KatS3mg082_0102 [Nitrospiraceae bacterium]